MGLYPHFCPLRYLTWQFFFQSKYFIEIIQIYGGEEDVYAC